MPPGRHGGQHLGHVGVDRLLAGGQGDRHPVVAVARRSAGRRPGTRRSAGSDSPRRWARASRSHRSRTRLEVGRNRRSKSRLRVHGADHGVQLDRLQAERPLAAQPERGDHLVERQDQVDVVGLAGAAAGPAGPAPGGGGRAGSRSRRRPGGTRSQRGTPVALGVRFGAGRPASMSSRCQPVTLRTTVRPSRWPPAAAPCRDATCPCSSTGGAQRGDQRGAARRTRGAPGRRRRPTPGGGAWVSSTSTPRPSRSRRHRARPRSAPGARGPAAARCTGSGRAVAQAAAEPGHPQPGHVDDPAVGVDRAVRPRAAGRQPGPQRQPGPATGGSRTGRDHGCRARRPAARRARSSGSPGSRTGRSPQARIRSAPRAGREIGATGPRRPRRRRRGREPPDDRMLPGLAARRLQRGASLPHVEAALAQRRPPPGRSRPAAPRSPPAGGLTSSRWQAIRSSVEVGAAERPQPLLLGRAAPVRVSMVSSSAPEPAQSARQPLDRLGCGRARAAPSASPRYRGTRRRCQHGVPGGGREQDHQRPARPAMGIHCSVSAGRGRASGHVAGWAVRADARPARDRPG